ncbi:MAG TPA: CbtB-domain containing protein [Usitatibacter sp.]|nr:CbtB-domain containing protein [Usitatibacter sp.]
MPSMQQQANNVNALSLSHAGPARAAVASACIGALLVYLAGFSQLEALHNGAHDARHAAAMPCH